MFGNIVRADLLDVFEREGIKGYIPHRVQWVALEPWFEDGERIKALPEYFHLEVAGKVNADTRLLGESNEECCPECKRINAIKGKKVTYGRRKLFIMRDTWDGADLCKLQNVALETLTIVSPKFIDVVSKYRLKCLFFGEGIPRVSFRAPVAENWRDEIIPKVAERYAELASLDPEGGYRMR